MRTHSILRLIAAAALASALISQAGAASATTTTKKVALIYGDSLTWESTAKITGHMDATKWKTYVHAFAGTAPCDWLQWLPADLAAYHPNVITLTTVGNSYGGCMIDPSTGTPYPLDSPAYLAKYQNDLSQFFAMASASGAHVLFLKGAPILDPTWNAAVTDVAHIASSLAPNYPNVKYSEAANLSVSNSGIYTDYMTCLTGETKAQGCVNKQIPVRTTVSGIQRGIHLCPNGIKNTLPACSIYSSGERRYGTAIAHATEAA